MEHEKTLIYYNVLNKHLKKEDAIEKTVYHSGKMVTSTQVEFEHLNERDDLKKSFKNPTVKFEENYNWDGYEVESIGSDIVVDNPNIIEINIPQSKEMDYSKVQCSVDGIKHNCTMDLAKYDEIPYLSAINLTNDFGQGMGVDKISIFGSVKSTEMKKVKMDSHNVELNCPSVESHRIGFDIAPITDSKKIYKNKGNISTKVEFSSLSKSIGDNKIKIEFSSLIEGDLSFSANVEINGDCCKAPSIDVRTDYVPNGLSKVHENMINTELADNLDEFIKASFKTGEVDVDRIINDVRVSISDAIDVDAANYFISSADELFCVDGFMMHDTVINDVVMDLKDIILVDYHCADILVERPCLTLGIERGFDLLNFNPRFSLGLLDGSYESESFEIAIKKLSVGIDSIKEMMGAYISLED